MFQSTRTLSWQALRRRVCLGSLAIAVVMLAALPAWSGSEAKDEDTINNATKVLHEMLNSNSIPPDLLSKAQCVMVLPDVKKAGFVVGGTGGRGPMTCRQGAAGGGGEAAWSAPMMYHVGG